MRKISKLCWIFSISLVPMLLVSCGHQHKYTKDVTKPTCTEEGFTFYFCEECGDYYEDNKIEPLGHDIVQHEGKAATCEESGYKEYVTCKRCTYSTYSSIPALDHSYGEATYSWNQDKTRVTATIICGNDEKHTITEMVDVEKEVISAQCKKSGLITYIAKFDSELFSTQTKEEVITELDHDLKIENAKDPTCTEVGHNAYEYCSRCDYTTKVEIPALGHSYNSDQICTRCENLAAWEYLTYEYDTELKGYVVTGLAIENQRQIKIPNDYMGNSVVKIKESAFANQDITEIEISDSIIEIGSKAFENCVNLSRLVIPKTVTKIGYHILAGCRQLAILSLPNVIRYGHLADYFSTTEFLNSYKTSKGYIPSSLWSVTIYGGFLYSFFSGCSNISEIELDGVQGLEKDVLTSNTLFKDCTSLESLCFDTSLESISVRTGLDTCPNFSRLLYKGNENDWAKITFGGYNAQIAQYANNIYFIDEETGDYTLVRKINITDPTIHQIGTAQFAGFKNLKELRLSSSVTEISSSAFIDCILLEKVILPNSITKISTGAFAGCDYIKSIETSFHSNLYPLLKVLFGEYGYEGSYRVGPTTNRASIPTSLEKLILHGDYQFWESEFKDMTSLKEIILEDVTVLPSNLFDNCTNLETIVLKDVVQIKANIFNNDLHYPKILYANTEEMWNTISIGANNDYCYIYYYSEEEPSEDPGGIGYDGRYWHYVDGVPTIWQMIL